jgi:flagellar biosynthesis/type III secretory pathway protein FliH
MLRLWVLNIESKITFEVWQWLFIAKEKETCKQILNQGLAQGQREYQIAVSKLVPYSVHKEIKKDILTLRHTCRALSMKEKISHR